MSAVLASHGAVTESFGRTEETYFPVYADEDRVENSIISFDVENLERVSVPLLLGSWLRDDCPSVFVVTVGREWCNIEGVVHYVIDYDMLCQQVMDAERLEKGKKPIPVEKIAARIRRHYVDSARLIKRAYGTRIDSDFQLYNWGLTLTMDMSLTTDKLELLMILYNKSMPRRIAKDDFENIVNKVRGGVSALVIKKPAMNMI